MSDVPALSAQSRYYRERASAIRARLPGVQDEEEFSELYLLAAHFERLAQFVDSSGSLGSPDVLSHGNRT